LPDFTGLGRYQQGYFDRFQNIMFIPLSQSYPGANLYNFHNAVIEWRRPRSTERMCTNYSGFLTAILKNHLARSYPEALVDNTKIILKYTIKWFGEAM